MLSEFEPVVNEWYVLSGEYAGSAELKTPIGTPLKGEGRVNWNDSGDCVISVEFGGEDFVAASKLALLDTHLDGITVTSADGIFRAKKVFLSSSRTNWGTAPQVVLEMQPLDAEFTPKGGVDPEYWATPLVNYVSNFHVSSANTDRHPLRIVPTPSIPSVIPECERLAVGLRANSRNHVIPFEYRGDVGFVEPLPNYKEVMEALKNGTRHRAATAMMVGNIKGLPWTSAEDVKRWFPMDLLYALALASGAFVGIPFIDFRDANGQLAKRIHVATARRRYESGFRIIHEILDSQGVSATGELMTKFLALDDTKRRYIGIALEYLLNAGIRVGDVENAFDYLVRGYESLTKVFGLSSQDLLNGVPASEQTNVRSILDSAAQSIRGISATLRNAGDIASADKIERTAARAASAAQRESMFGLAVSDLLKKYGFPDESIINAYYLANPRSDGIQSWSQVVTTYRGGVIHVGYLDVSTNERLRDVYRFIRHLHDILARIVLTEVGYIGTYQATVSTWQQPRPVNWVTSGTSASELGYS